MITVISGLPRSGTSLMMQMLEAGGMEILADECRKPDADNPRGYYELEEVKLLSRDASWLTRSEEKAIKIVSPLLCELPSSSMYQIIFMTRDMSEILDSQKAMLERAGHQLGPDDSAMRRYFEDHLKKVRHHLALAQHCTVFDCSYNNLLAVPNAILDDLLPFLGRDLEREPMLGCIDKTLYRQRNGSMG